MEILYLQNDNSDLLHDHICVILTSWVILWNIGFLWQEGNLLHLSFVYSAVSCRGVYHLFTCMWSSDSMNSDHNSDVRMFLSCFMMFFWTNIVSNKTGSASSMRIRRHQLTGIPVGPLEFPWQWEYTSSLHGNGNWNDMTVLLCLKFPN